VFIHGDLQADHVFVDGDEVTGVVDWSEASQGDALFDVDRDLIRAWWSLLTRPRAASCSRRQRGLTGAWLSSAREGEQSLARRQRGGLARKPVRSH
jgi:aminoglycoside phosphotransferase (APT) family kinase protein